MHASAFEKMDVRELGVAFSISHVLIRLLSYFVNHDD